LGEVGLFRKNGKKREKKMEMVKIWTAVAMVVGGGGWRCLMVGGGGMRCWACVLGGEMGKELFSAVKERGEKKGGK
jgi:hypothetical protein